MKISEIMSTEVVTSAESDTIEDLVRLMRERAIGCVPIVDKDGKLTGIITKSDLIPKQYRGPFETKAEAYLFGMPVLNDNLEDIYASVRRMTVGEVMSSPVITVTEEDVAHTAIKKMLGNNINHLPVVRDGVLVGIVSRQDLLSVIR